jgi:uncharacterized membrane protein
MDQSDRVDSGDVARGSESTPPVHERGGIGAAIKVAVKTRIARGLILALPIAITWWIVFQLYLTLQSLVITPVNWVIRRVMGAQTVEGLPAWWDHYVAPVFAIACVLTILYFLGLLVTTSMARVIDWFMTRVPIVTSIYQAVRKVFQSLTSSSGGSKFKRVVSVPYPTATIRTPGFVMKSMEDVTTKKVILSVFVPFSPLPTSGFLLLVPEDEVIDTGWSVNDTMQAIISGGISMPPTLQFTKKTE